MESPLHRNNSLIQDQGLKVSTVDDFLRFHRTPRRVFRRKLAEVREAEAFAYLLAGCAMIFASRIPDLLKSVVDGPGGVQFVARASGIFVGTVIVAPMFFYALSAGFGLLVSLIRGNKSWLHCRIILFWSVLVVSPWSMAIELLGQAIENVLFSRLLSFLLFFGFVAILTVGLTESIRRR